MRGCPIPGEGAELLLLVRLPGWEWSDVPVDVPVPGLAAQAQDVEPLGGSFSVSLPRFLLRAARRVAGGAAARPGGSGVHRATGRAAAGAEVVAGIFKPAAVQAGLPHRLRFHNLRHTCASLLIAQGASVKAVQAQLGHASATVTLDRYGHLFPDELQRLAERLQEAYGDTVTDPARTEPPETVPLERKEAGR